MLGRVARANASEDMFRVMMDDGVGIDLLLMLGDACYDRGSTFRVIFVFRMTGLLNPKNVRNMFFFS